VAIAVLFLLEQVQQQAVAAGLYCCLLEVAPVVLVERFSDMLVEARYIPAAL